MKVLERSVVQVEQYKAWQLQKEHALTSIAEIYWGRTESPGC